MKMIVANQNPNDFCRTLSPNELNILSSEQESNDHKENHDLIRKSIKVDQNLDMPEVQEPHTGSNPNPLLLSNAELKADV